MESLSWKTISGGQVNPAPCPIPEDRTGGQEARRTGGQEDRSAQLHIPPQRTFSPAPTRKSTSTDFSFVCPDLKSSPQMKTRRCAANSTAPGTKVFWGDPLM